MTTASASAVNRYLLTPVNKTTGKKTIAVLKVAASTASWTSLPPSSAALTLSEPISKCRKMFSSTTTELSINRESRYWVSLLFHKTETGKGIAGAGGTD